MSDSRQKVLACSQPCIVDWLKIKLSPMNNDKKTLMCSHPGRSVVQ